MTTSNLEISIAPRNKDTQELAVWMKHGKKSAPFCAAHIVNGIVRPVSTMHERFPGALKSFCDANGLAMTNPVGRPRIVEPRKNVLKVGFTDSEWQRLTTIVGGGSIAEYVRSKTLG